MEKRFRLKETLPDGYKALMALDGYLKTTSLDKKHYELIKLRASQINGCAFCLHFHLHDALKFGEQVDRIVLLNAWKDAQAFTDEEKAILTLTDAVTLVNVNGISEEIYQNCITILGEEYTALAMLAIISINSLNRLAKTCLMQPGEKSRSTQAQPIQKS